MRDGQRDDAFRRLVQRIDPAGKLLRTWGLTGGVSAQVTAIEIARADGQTAKLIVRQHGEADRGRNAHIARDEFKLLRITHAHGLRAPEPVFLDEFCDLFSTPVLVIEYVDGDTDFVPADVAAYLEQMAAELARIHTVKSTPDLSFLPALDKGFGSRPGALDDDLDEGRIRDALESAWPLPRMNDSVLLHGDYWPGNILWNDGRLAAVIDWEDAAVGDPLADLANSRLEILWSHGPDAMNDYTERYRSLATADFANLPYWDLCAALRPCAKIAGWGLDEAMERRMRERHRLFVGQALEGLSVR
jgi:aminoglycoside phosphotransferase (APT) family kinase protein